jgi:hypothetical protein
MAQAHGIQSTRATRWAADMTGVMLGFITLDLHGESYTVPMESAMIDGEYYDRIAEHVLGGKFANVTFRFIR